MGVGSPMSLKELREDVLLLSGVIVTLFNMIFAELLVELNPKATEVAPKIPKITRKLI